MDEQARRVARALHQRLALDSAHLAGLGRRLEALSPLAVLGRGYAVVTRFQDGSLIVAAKQAPVGSILQVRLAEGSLKVTVQESGQER